MKVIHCSNCDEPLPETAKYCAHCGMSLTSPQIPAVESSNSDMKANLRDNTSSFDEMQPWGLGRLDKMRDRSLSLKVPHFYAMSSDTNPSIEATGIEEEENTQPLGFKSNETAQKTGNHKKVLTVTPEQWQILSNNDNSSQLRGSYNQHDDFSNNHATWNKAVPEKSTRTPSGGVAVATRPTTTTATQSEIPKPAPRIPSALILWGSMLIILCLLLAGLFGIIKPLTHMGRTYAAKPGDIALRITPVRTTFYGTLTLSGSNFGPHTNIRLSRDNNIPIVDTNSKNIVKADSRGSFTSIVIVDPSWLAGSHTIYAESALLHKTASFNVFVTGQSLSLRPAHLQLLPTTIDLGTGDQASNATQTITLTNNGGGEITWQSAPTQSWLLVTPKSGTLASQQSITVTIAGDRSALTPGSYAANVIFSSDAGNVSLPVKIQVTPLQVGQKAVLELAPAVLSFTGIDGGTNPAGQSVTVSNPGVQPLQWNSSTSTNDGSNWLSASPQSGTISSSGNQSVMVNVNISSLLPGMYTGTLKFDNAGTSAIVDSPQSIIVSVTILPQCSLQASPGNLTFTSAYSQPAPASQTINIGISQGCTTQIHWNATVTTYNGGQWLGIDTGSGSTPSNVVVHLNVSGLTPGTYNGSVLLSSISGSQTLPVTFIMGKPTAPVTLSSPRSMFFSGILTQPNPASQTVSVVNSGGGILVWNVIAATSVGGSWLLVKPSGGTLVANESVPINVSVALLPGLVPGTYNGTITINGTDGSGNPAVGTPELIPVTFVVQAPCTIAAAPVALGFTGVAGQPNPPTQNVALTANGACGPTLNWSATTSANWLNATPNNGNVSLTTASGTTIGVVLAGLAPGSYTGSVTLTATDSSTKQQVGAPQVIKISLTVQPPCTLQAPSVGVRNFTVEQGLNPGPKSFSIGVSGVCNGSVTITPTVIVNTGSGWLGVSTSSATVSSGGSAPFTIGITSSALTPGVYTGSISLAAADANGAIAGSTQTVNVRLRVFAPPNLTVSTTALTYNVTTGSGVSSQAITIGNSGGEPLNWSAAFDSSAPTFVSLSATSGTKLAGGKNIPLSVNVDTTGVAPGTYTTNLTISAIDPITNAAVSGSPVTVSITINVAAPPPAMQLSGTTVSITITNGNGQTTQSITITNSGGSTLTWSAGTPSASWLTVSPPSGSDAAGASSTITFSANITGMSPGTYNATVDITPSTGSVTTVSVTLTIS